MTAANNGTGSTTMLAHHPPFRGGKSMQTLLRWQEKQEQPQHDTSNTNDLPTTTRRVSHGSANDSDEEEEWVRDSRSSPRWCGAEILPPPKFEIEGPLLCCLPTSGDAVEAIAVTIVDATDEENFIFTGLAEDFLFVAAARQHTDDDDDDHDETRNEHEARVGSASSSSLICRGGSNPDDDEEEQQEDPAPKRRKISMEEEYEEAETLEAACLSSSTRRTTAQDHRNYIDEDSS